MTNEPDETSRPEPTSPPHWGARWGDPFHYGLPRPPRVPDAGPRPDGAPPAPAVDPGSAHEADLVEVVLRAIGGQRGGAPTLWFLVLDSGDRPAPVVLPVEHASVAPSETVADLLVRVLVSVVQHEAPGGSVLIAYTREGGGAHGAFERGWSGVLRAMAARAGLRIRAEVAIGPHRAGVIRA